MPSLICIFFFISTTYKCNFIGDKCFLPPNSRCIYALLIAKYSETLAPANSFLPQPCLPQIKMVRLRRYYEPAVRNFRWCGYAAIMSLRCAKLDGAALPPFPAFSGLCGAPSSQVYASGGILQKKNPTHNLLIL